MDFESIKALDFTEQSITIEIDGETYKFHFSEVEFIKYTGLIDIEGREIYDADILKDDENFLWLVKYKQGAFVAECSDLMAEQQLSSINLYSKTIGNNLKNPELLGVSS